MENDFNILIGKWEERDKDLFFGPLNNSSIFIVSEQVLLSSLLFELNLFSSKSQAKKAGWDKSIPSGFSTYEIGKKRTRVTILNVVE
jgi:hypothetical protein